MKHEYLNKSSEYFQHIRTDILSFMGEQRNLTVLEVGSGYGYTLLEMKRRGMAQSIHGNDIVETDNPKTDFDSYLVGDIEQTTLEYPSAYFDAIIFADVLEHLIDPKTVIHKLLPHLKPGGSFYASLPNIRYFSALYKIAVKGNFKYEEIGIFDKTHLRFYCKSDAIELFDQIPGVQLEIIASNLHHIPKNKKVLANKMTAGLLEQFLTFQYLIKATKIAG
ncbi:MAG: putative glycosyltransferase [Pseudomonadota bacterium]|jgi:2-polyprenyl-3-methyl-5-hydroxy-6-metoxy-1,4-benzoquinol methylase